MNEFNPYAGTCTGTAAQTYPEHSCYEWNRQHYVSTPEYFATECGTCGHITGFKWRRPWRRFVSLFTSDPIKYASEIRFWLEREWRLWRWRRGTPAEENK